jgi:hypothetical protein
MSPSNEHASELMYYKGTTDVNGFILDSHTAPAANTMYTFDYFIAQ